VDDNLMIEIESLSKSFGKIKALDNLNLDIKKGESSGPTGRVRPLPSGSPAASSNQTQVMYWWTV